MTGENRWANDIDGSALAAQPGKSQGRPLKSPGSKPIAQIGLPSLRSPEGPCPSRPNIRPAPDDTSAFKEQFHAASSGPEASAFACLVAGAGTSWDGRSRCGPPVPSDVGSSRVRALISVSVSAGG